MKIKWGAMVTEGRGKLGGHVASKGKGADIFFTKPRAVNRQTQYQGTQRSIFAELSRGWSGLTAAQIRGWNEAVELFRYTNVFGDSKVLSGKALYQKLNTNLILSGQSDIRDAPIPMATGSAITDMVVISTATGSVTVQTPTSNANLFAIYYATPILSDGTRYFVDQFKLLGAVQFNASGDATLTLGYANRFGVPPAGVNIGFGMRLIASNGQASSQAIQLLTTS